MNYLSLFFIALSSIFIFGSATPVNEIKVECKSDTASTSDTDVLCDSGDKKVDISTELGSCDYESFESIDVNSTKWDAAKKNCEDSKFIFSDSIIVEVIDNLSHTFDNIIVNTQSILKNQGRDIVKDYNGVSPITKPTPIPNPTPSSGYPYVDIADKPYDNLKQKDAIILAPPGTGVESIKVEGKGKVSGHNGSNVVIVADKLQKLDIDVSGYDGLSGEAPATYLAKAAMRVNGLYNDVIELAQDIPEKIANNYLFLRTKDTGRLSTTSMTIEEINDYKSSGLNCSAERGETQLDNTLTTADGSDLPLSMTATSQVREQSKRTMCIRDPEFQVTQECTAEKEYSFQAVCKIEPETRNLFVYKRNPITWNRAICGTNMDNQLKKSIRRNAFVTVTTGNGKSYSGKISRLIKFDESRQFYRYDKDVVAVKDASNYASISTPAAPNGYQFTSPFWEQKLGVNISSITNNNVMDTAVEAGSNRGIKYLNNDQGSALTYTVKNKELIPYLGLPTSDPNGYKINLGENFPLKKSDGNVIKKEQNGGYIFVGNDYTHFSSSDNTSVSSINNASNKINKIVSGNGYYIGISPISATDSGFYYTQNAGNNPTAWINAIKRGSDTRYESEKLVLNRIVAVSKLNINGVDYIQITTEHPHQYNNNNRVYLDKFGDTNSFSQLNGKMYEVKNLDPYNNYAFIIKASIDGTGNSFTGSPYVAAYNLEINKIKRENNLVTVETKNSHDYIVGDKVKISITDQILGNLNGVFTIKSITDSSFTYQSNGVNIAESTVMGSSYVSSIFIDSNFVKKDDNSVCTDVDRSINEIKYMKEKNQFIAVGNCGTVRIIKISNGYLEAKILPYFAYDSNMLNYVDQSINTYKDIYSFVYLLDNDSDKYNIYYSGKNYFSLCVDFECSKAAYPFKNYVESISNLSIGGDKILGTIGFVFSNSNQKPSALGNDINSGEFALFKYNITNQSEWPNKVSVLTMSSTKNLTVSSNIITAEFNHYIISNNSSDQNDIIKSGIYEVKGGFLHGLTNIDSPNKIFPIKGIFDTIRGQFVYIYDNTNVSNRYGYIFELKPGNDSYNFNNWTFNLKYIKDNVKDISFSDSDLNGENASLLLLGNNSFYETSEYLKKTNINGLTLSSVTKIISKVNLIQTMYKDIFPWMKGGNNFTNCGILAELDGDSFYKDSLEDSSYIESNFKSYIGNNGERKKFSDNINDYDLGLDYFFAFDSRTIGISTQDLKTPGTQVFVSNCTANVEIESIESSSLTYEDWYKATGMPKTCASGNTVGLQSINMYERDDSCYFDNPVNVAGNNTVPLWLVEKKCLEDTVCKNVYDSINDSTTSFKVSPSTIFNMLGNAESFPPAINTKELKKEYILKYFRDTKNAVRWNTLSLFDMSGSNWSCTDDGSCGKYDVVKIYKQGIEESSSVFEPAKLFIDLLPDKDFVIANGKFEIEDYCIPTPNLSSDPAASFEDSFYSVDRIFYKDNLSTKMSNKSILKIFKSVPIIDYSVVDGQSDTSYRNKMVCPSGIRLDKFVTSMKKSFCPNGTSSGKYYSSWSSSAEDGNWSTYSQKESEDEKPDVSKFTSQAINVSKSSEIIDMRYDEMPNKIYTSWTADVDPKVNIAPEKTALSPGTFTGKFFPEPYGFTDSTGNFEYFTLDKKVSGIRKYKGWARENSLMSKDGYVTELDKFIPFAGNSYLERGDNWCNLNAYEVKDNMMVKGFGARNMYSSPGRQVYRFKFKQTKICSSITDQNTCNSDQRCEYNTTDNKCDAKEIEYMGIEVADIKKAGSEEAYGFYGLEDKIYTTYSDGKDSCTYFTTSETCDIKYCQWNPSATDNRCTAKTKVKDSAFLSTAYPKFRSFQDSCGTGEVYDEVLGSCRLESTSNPNDTWKPTRRIMQYSRYKDLNTVETTKYINNFMSNSDLFFNVLHNGLPFSLSSVGKTSFNTSNYENNNYLQLGLFRPMSRMIASDKEDSSMRNGKNISRAEFLNRPELTDIPVAGFGQSLKADAESNGICEEGFNNFRMIALPIIRENNGKISKITNNDSASFFDYYADDQSKSEAKKLGIMYFDLPFKRCNSTVNKNILNDLYIALYNNENIIEYKKSPSSSGSKLNGIDVVDGKINIQISDGGDTEYIASITDISSTIITGKSMTNGKEKLKFVELSTPIERGSSLDSRDKYWKNKYSNTIISGMTSFPEKLKTESTESSTNRTEKPKTCSVTNLKSGSLGDSVIELSYSKSPGNTKNYIAYKWDQGYCKDNSFINNRCEKEWVSQLGNTSLVLKFGDTKTSVFNVFSDNLINDSADLNKTLPDFAGTTTNKLYVTGGSNNGVNPFYYIRIMPIVNTSGTDTVDTDEIKVVKFSIMNNNGDLFDNLYGDDSTQTANTDSEEALSIYTKGDPTGLGSLNLTVKGITQFTPWTHELTGAFGPGFGSWTKQDGSGQGTAPEPDCHMVFGQTTGKLNLKPITSGSTLTLDAATGYEAEGDKYNVRAPGSSIFAKIDSDESLRKSSGCLRWDSIDATKCEINGETFLSNNGFLEFSLENEPNEKWRKLYVETRERISQECSEFEIENNVLTNKCKTVKCDLFEGKLYQKYSDGTWKISAGNKVLCPNTVTTAGTVLNPARPNQATVVCTPFDCSLPMTKVTEKVESSIVLSGRGGENGTNGGSAIVFCRDCKGTELNYNSRGGRGGSPSYPTSSNRSHTIFCGYSSVNPLNPSFFVRELWSQPFVGGSSGIPGASGRNGQSLRMYQDVTPEVIFQLSDPDFWKK